MRLLMVVCAILSLAPAALAGNAQHGDNVARDGQSGAARSGDAVGGPGLVIVHEGDLSLEMRNAPGVEAQVVRSSPGELRVESSSTPVTARTGDATGSNRASAFVGLSVSSASLADVFRFAIDRR